MSDGYQTKVYCDQNGDRQVIESGGTVLVKSGGQIVVQSGGVIELNTGAALTVNSVDLIASIAALSGLDSTELGYLNSVVAGTAAASKVVVLDSGGDVTWPEGGDIALGTTTGTKIGTATAQKLAFHNSTPVIQRAAAAQASVTTTVGAAVATTAATNVAPYGFTQAQADAIIANLNALRVDVLAVVVLDNEVRAALVEKGIIKGAA